VRLARLNDRPVLLVADGFVDIGRTSAGRFGDGDPMGPFHNWPEFVQWAAGVQGAGEPLGDRVLQNPVPRPTQVFAVGANYQAHLIEAGAPEGTTQKDVLIFTKFASCLVGPFDPIPTPNATVDWEVELVAVMGRCAERVPADRAWEYVAGLTVGQDISDRTLQFVGLSPQFSMSKSYPGFGPLGPSVVTLDEFANPDDLELGCSLDGSVMQLGRTSDLIFPVPELIERISAVCPLLPGDLIFSGTPAGVGAFRTPPVFLRPGQELVSWIEGVGELRNPIVEPPSDAARTP
jgi:2,4-diketo-3-deoxy-L-fuconate hydrolase